MSGAAASSSLSDLEARSDQHVRRKPLECGRERAIERTLAAGPSSLSDLEARSDPSGSGHRK